MAQSTDSQERPAGAAASSSNRCGSPPQGNPALFGGARSGRYRRHGLEGTVALLLAGCGLGIRGITHPSYEEQVEAQKREERRAAAEQRRERARQHCERENTVYVLGEREKHTRAKRALKAATERLRVAEELHDAATIYEAMKSRDEAEEAVRATWWPTDKDQRKLVDECVAARLASNLP